MQMLKCTQVTGPVQEWKWHQVQNVNLKNKSSSSSKTKTFFFYLEKEAIFDAFCCERGEKKTHIKKQTSTSAFSPNF